MEKIINIDGKPIKMRVTARIHAEYREAFGKDLLLELAKSSSEDADNLSEVIDNLAWLMAKKAGNQVHPPELTASEAVGEWLDGMESGSAISNISGEILSLYYASESGHSTPAKK